MGKSKKTHSERQAIHLGIWMIGLGLFFLVDRVWPGVFILIGVSMLIESLSDRGDERPAAARAKPAAEKPASETSQPEKEEQPAVEVVDVVPEEVEQSAFPYRTDLLPEKCPWCGAPVPSNEVRWSGYREAHCPFCEANLIDGGPQSFYRH